MLLSVLLSYAVAAQSKTENIVIVTLDGMRWQELFGGADSVLLRNSNYTKERQNTTKLFWEVNQKERREKLFPFIWNTISVHGQIHGNRKEGSKVNVANPYHFSYPGYNEILTGFPDSAVNSNDKILNKNTNVLEYINNQEGYKGKVAAFTTWDVFPYIINKWRNGIYVNADVDTLKFENSRLQLVNDLQFLTAKPIDVRPDVVTYLAAREYLKAFHPKVLYIAFDETDDFAHAGEYDQYLKSAHAEDAMLADIWKILQSDSQYKNNTTLLVTCDHGRGDINKDNWRHHGQQIAESGETWFAIMGPGIKNKGESTIQEQIYQEQYAATLAALLGFQFIAPHPVGASIKELLIN